MVEVIVRPGNEPGPTKSKGLNVLVLAGGRERAADDFGRPYAGAGFRPGTIVRAGSPFCIIEGVPV